MPKGLTPTISLPTEKAEVGKQYSLDDVDPIGRIEVLIYSPPGNGKTVLAATFPPPFRWLAADGATCLKSVRWALKAGITSITDPKTDLIAYSPIEDAYPSASAAYNKACDMVAHWFSPGEVDKWATLVIDSATALDEWTLNRGLELNSQLPTVTKPLSTSHTTNTKAKSRLVTGQQDYKSAMGLFQSFINDVRADCARYNKNLVVLCHVYTEETEDGTVISYKPLLTGQLRERIVKDFDDVWFVERFNGPKGPEVKILVHADPRHCCKTRWGNALSTSEEPDFRKMIAKVRAFHGL